MFHIVEINYAEHSEQWHRYIHEDYKHKALLYFNRQQSYIASLQIELHRNICVPEFESATDLDLGIQQKEAWSQSFGQFSCTLYAPISNFT